VDPADVYIQKNTYHYSSSYTFYTASMFKTFDDSLLNKGRKVWLQAEPDQLEELKKAYELGLIYSVPHFRVTMLTLKFINPATRDKAYSRMMLVEITGKK